LVYIKNLKSYKMFLHNLQKLFHWVNIFNFKQFTATNLSFKNFVWFTFWRIKKQMLLKLLSHTSGIYELHNVLWFMMAVSTVADIIWIVLIILWMVHLMDSWFSFKKQWDIEIDLAITNIILWTALHYLVIKKLVNVGM
jgi:hypothetical protein